MVRSINFLDARPHFRFLSAFTRVRARLVLYGGAVGLAIAVLMVSFLAARMQVQHLEGGEALLRARLESLDHERGLRDAALDDRVGDLGPVLARLEAIRQSGPALAARIAKVGNEAPTGSWLDSTTDELDGVADTALSKVAMKGGVRSLTLLATLMRNLRGSDVDPRLKVSLPQEGRRTYLSYDISAAPAAPALTPASARTTQSYGAIPSTVPQSAPSPAATASTAPASTATPAPGHTPLTLGGQP